MEDNENNFEIKGNVHIPFSPILLECTLPLPYIKMFNDYGDKISVDEKLTKEQDCSDVLVGNTQQEHYVDNELWERKFVDKGLPTFFNWVQGCVHLYIKSFDKSILNENTTAEAIANKKMTIIKNGWIVNSIAGDFNPFHAHSGTISAVGYLKVPESIEKDLEREKAGWIQFMYGTNHPYVDPYYDCKPQVGKMMFFPSWLQHQVYPFRSKSLRRSLSFNLALENIKE
jgi:hypothetical protein